MSFYIFSINIYAAIILGVIFLFIFPFLLKTTTEKIAYITIYYISLLLGVLNRVSINNQEIIIEFFTTHQWFSNKINIAYFQRNTILINILLCFPIGVIFPDLLTKINILKVLLLGLITSFSIEILQFILPISRSPEILDILTNLISVVLGFYYYLIIKKAKSLRT